MSLIYNACMYLEDHIWLAFQKALPASFEKTHEVLLESTENWLYQHFMSLCESEVLHLLDLSQEELEEIIYVKAQMIHEMRNQTFDMESCRKLPLSAGALYSLLCKQLLEKDASASRYKTLNKYQYELYGNLITERRARKDGLSMSDVID